MLVRKLRDMSVMPVHAITLQTSAW